MRQHAPLLVVLLVVLLGGHSIWIKHVTAQEAAEYNHQLSAIAAVDQEHAAFAASLQQIRGDYPGVQVSVAAAGPGLGVRAFGDAGPYDAASTAKLLTAAAFLHQVDEGHASLQTSIAGRSAAYWLRSMLIQSDDDAWANLNNYLTHDYLAAYAKETGIDDYSPDTNSLSAYDMALLCQKLMTGNLLQTRRQTLLLHLMEQANYRDYVVAAVPNGYHVYHKVGFTDGNIHDVAVISRGGQWRVLSVFTNGDDTYSTAQRAALIQNITRAALRVYF